LQKPHRRIAARASIQGVGLGVGAVLIACTALPASAQRVTNGPNAAPARDISITPTVRLTYDSNVLGSRNLPLTNVRSADDVRVSPELNVAITTPVGAQSAYLSGTIGYDFYRRNTQLDRERIDLDGGLNLRTPSGRCTGGVGAAYSRGQSNIGDLIILPDESGFIDAVNVQQEVVLRANIACGAAYGLAPGIGYSRQTVTNSNFRDDQNISADTYTASLAWRGARAGTITLAGSYRDGRYPNRVLLNGDEDGIEVYSGTVTYDRDIGTRYGGTISAGYTKVKPRAPGVADFNGLTYAAAIRALLTDRLSTNLSVSRDAQQSNLLALSYSINTTYAFTGVYQFSERLSAPFGVSYQRRRFETGPDIPGAILAGRSDNLYSANVGLNFRPRPRLNLGISGMYTRRESNTALLDYNSKQVSVFAGITL
jgi:hypothetical protein